MNTSDDGWGYKGSIKLIWEGPVPPGAEDAVINDIRNEIGCESPADLCFHHVPLTDAGLRGPLVFVHGVPGSDAFHCEYVETPKWTSRPATDVGKERGV